jgi:hypothetical protein
MVFVDVGLHQIFAPKGIYVLSTLELVVDDRMKDSRFLLYQRKYNIESSLLLVFNYCNSLFLEFAFFKFIILNKQKHLKI